MSEVPRAKARRPADRWPHIAFELGRARINDAMWSAWDVGDGPALRDLDHATLLTVAQDALQHVEALVSLLHAIDAAIPDPGLTTLDEVIAPMREYLAWTFDSDRPFEGRAVLLEDVERVGRPAVRVLIELAVVGGAGAGPVPRPDEGNGGQ
ncbi:hypothetical protein [Kitasatospora kifunensis]|uniref:Uncharacterized protein n=1 Tax=Kitasatospora kifunensis TaxID=58351 RepID=A0A7W7R0I9_KITKI|nr:hypothetical protein [Kitasatospora kifunensis]MBB4923211.1 hypothetical protein [Kitasatospora kifunensis]